ncbi:MAG TPA: NUDIX domain-containing protein [Anaerolineales bacterium]|nr:NUDIX domain-containing protein [Anaerolineales bacterium]
MPVGRFLGGIAALIQDPKTQKYLLLRRLADRDFGAGAWECVTGRVDQGESYEVALHREVQEEIGAQVQIDFIISTTHFHRGAPAPENELLGIVYACTLLSDPDQLAITEHSEHHWLTRAEIFAFLPADHWLRTVIARAETIRAYLSPELAAYFREKGTRI